MASRQNKKRPHYDDIDCVEKHEINHFIVKESIKFIPNPKCLILDAEKMQTTSIFIKEGIDAKNIDIVELDKKTANTLRKKGEMFGIIDDHIYNTSVYDYLLTLNSVVYQVIYLDYMCSFRGNDKHKPLDERRSCPERDINLLLHLIPNNHLFILATTFCLRSNDKIDNKHDAVINDQYACMKSLFEKYNIIIRKQLIKYNEDGTKQIGRRYRQKTTKRKRKTPKNHMYFMLYVLHKNPI